MKMTGQMNHHDTKNKIKTKQEIKFQHDCANWAFADLQISPHLMDSSQVEFDNFHCRENQNETQCRSDLKGNNDLIADDGSVSDNELSKLGATFSKNNAMDEYIPDDNYNPEWMEMDGEYKIYYNWIEMDLFGWTTF